MPCDNPRCNYCYPDNRKKFKVDEDYEFDRRDCPPDDRRPPDSQTHTHEFTGSEMIAGSIPHNHRFAGVTSEEIKVGKSHIHAILTNDDFFFNHHHEVGVKTGFPIYVDGDKHIHFVKGQTTTNFGHHHDFIFATLIDNPLEK